MIRLEPGTREQLGDWPIVVDDTPNPTALALAIAVTPGDPEPGDWHAAQWDTDADGSFSARSSDTYGPVDSGADHELARGSYKVRVKVNEAAVLRVDTVVVF